MVVLTNNGILGCSESFCFYCGRPVRKVEYRLGRTPPPDQRTEDHIIPKSKGGIKTVNACLAVTKIRKICRLMNTD